MSTIVTSNVSDGTLSIPTTYVTNGSAKAWVNFNGTGTIAARDSFNVASLTDNGTGNYTVNFADAMGNGDYSVSGLSSENGGGQNARVVSLSTTAAQVQSTDAGNNALTDTAIFTLNVHGDLA
jgi:hypothetical protein